VRRTPIVTINGINHNGPATVERLGRNLDSRGFQVETLSYPTRKWWQTRNRRSQYQDALRMLRQLPDRPVDVVAHSWGCMLACRMMELGGTEIFRNVFFFAPAIDKDWIFPEEAFRHLWVIHHEQDRAVLAAKIFFLGWHPWGDMGRYGYAGEHKRVISVRDETERANIFDLMHGHYFQKPHVDRWGQFVTDHIAAL
jgi:pimeloyl-ACP methyl ester carboxylesterase